MTSLALENYNILEILVENLALLRLRVVPDLIKALSAGRAPVASLNQVGRGFPDMFIEAFSRDELVLFYSSFIGESRD